MALQAGRLMLQGGAPAVGASPLPGQVEFFDCSNYTALPTAAQLDCLAQRFKGGAIGLQDAGKARVWRDALAGRGMCREYYVDLPGRDLSIPEAGAIVWIDIEPGCFVRDYDVVGARRAIEYEGLRPGIYGNRVSVQPVFGDSDILADLPLWYADWRTPDPATFVGFNGWRAPARWQYSGTVQQCGVGVDQNVYLAEVPPPVPPVPPYPDLRVDFALYEAQRRLFVATMPGGGSLVRPGRSPGVVNVCFLDGRNQAVEPGVDVPLVRAREDP